MYLKSSSVWRGERHQVQGSSISQWHGSHALICIIGCAEKKNDKMKKNVLCFEESLSQSKESQRPTDLKYSFL
jgi:hypothetical protein